MTLRIGLVVNPVAGLGGAVGLGGSDGERVRREAVRRGGRPRAGDAASAALRATLAAVPDARLLALDGEMGGDAILAAGGRVHSVGAAPPGTTSAADTVRAARLLAPRVDLLLFSGGDGTARDLVAADVAPVPVLGVPGGVKMQSSVFATSSRAVADVVAALQAGTATTEEREVVDLDEEARRRGVLSARLFGTLRVPVAPGRVQGRKLGMSDAPWGDVRSAATAAVAELRPGRRYALAPGTTVAAVAELLGVESTLLGVDVVEDGRLLARDVDRAGLLELIRPGDGVVASPIGGQGFLFGRGDQQLGPEVLARVGLGGVICVAAEGKLAALGGRPLLVDTGDPLVDAALSGHVRCHVAPGRSAMYPVSAA